MAMLLATEHFRGGLDSIEGSLLGSLISFAISTIIESLYMRIHDDL